MKKFALITAFIASFCRLLAQGQPLSYFLPEQHYDKNIPTPAQFLGWQIGEWHVSHDQVVAYMRELDRLSDRISIQEYGKTYEQRPLMVLFITHPENHLRMTEIREAHQQLCDANRADDMNTAQMPLVIYQGHSIHGNEPSGTNAAMLMAYHYAAATGPDMDRLLRNTVILFDPCFNPDGLQRFSTWVNQHKSKNLNGDGAGREYNEVWPGGRANHYYFDLNRDWLVSQMPESQGRVRLFQEWRPNILTDHHEMGTNSSFFFQPGVQSRVNELTPATNQELTAKIARFHAKTLDKIGSLYFTEENFDDYYYGKGSTYPDAHGGIGILFEQASSRGHLQRSNSGPISFAFTIRNQVATSLSTLEAAMAMRKELLDYQRDFFKNSLKEAQNSKNKAVVFKHPGDESRLYEFLKILQRNKIRIYENKKSILCGDLGFEAGNSFIIPLQQSQYKLIQTLFEQRTRFRDSLFYDISAWTLPLAFNIKYAFTDEKTEMGKEIIDFEKPRGQIMGSRSEYAYVMDWNDYLAPSALNLLLGEGLNIKAATKAFTATTNGSFHKFSCGSILIPVQNQPNGIDAVHRAVEQLVLRTGISIYPLETGLTTEGIDAGSNQFQSLKTPRVAVIVGKGAGMHEAGEAWHLLDQRYDMAVTCLESDELSKSNLGNYNFIFLPDGSYGSISENGKAKLKEWIAAGNTLYASGGEVLRWLKEQNIGSIKIRKKTENKDKKTEEKIRRAYADAENDNGSKNLSGAIFGCDADLSHPLCFGYDDRKIPVFVTDTVFMEMPQNVYAAPLQFGNAPLLTGYVHSSTLDQMKGSAALCVYGIGSGRLIAASPNVNFRGTWYGTNKILANAIFFGHLINRNCTER